MYDNKGTNCTQSKSNQRMLRMRENGHHEIFLSESQILKF